MGFGLFLIIESIFILAAGSTILGGIKGMIISAIIVSGVNFFFHGIDSFLPWEIPLLIGTAVGMISLYVINRKAKGSHFLSGVVGSIISLVLFGAFITPLLAILLWALIMGTGLIPKPQKRQVLWSLAPTVLLLIYGIGWVIYGNFLIP